MVTYALHLITHFVSIVTFLKNKLSFSFFEERWFDITILYIDIHGWREIAMDEKIINGI
jgi:hypothetical protein